MPHVISRPGLVFGTTMAVFLALVHAVNDLVTASIGALLPTLQARFVASTTTLAVLVGVYSVSSSVTQPFLGALADRWGLRRVAGLGVALAATSLSLLGVAGSIGLVIVLLLIGGIGSAALHPVGTAIVGGPTSKNPSLAVGLFTAGGMVGFGLGPVVILYLVSRHGPGITPWLMLPGLALAVGVITLLPVWEPHDRAPITRIVDRRAFSGRIGRLTVAATLISLAFITFTSAVPLWLVAEHQLPTDTPLLGWVLGGFSFAAAAGAVAAGILYIAVGALQGLLGLAPAVLLTFTVLVPAALLARNSLRDSR